MGVGISSSGGGVGVGELFGAKVLTRMAGGSAPIAPPSCGGVGVRMLTRMAGVSVGAG